MKPTDLDDLDPVEPDEETLARVRSRSGAFRRRRMGQRLASVAAGVLVVALAVGIAIGRVDSGSPDVNEAPSTTTTTPTVANTDLEGTWRPVSIAGWEHSLLGLSITFHGTERFDAADGCNFVGGTWGPGSNGTVGFQVLETTRKLCTRIAPLVRVLSRATRIELRDGNFKLYGADGHELADFVPAGVTTRVDLPSHTMVAGTRMTGRLMVDNETGKVIPATGCISLFQVILTNASYQPLVPWPDCLEELDIPTGVSTVPFVVLGSVNAGTAPLGPLPPGRYTAELYQSSRVVSDPPPFTVEVVAP